AEGEAAGERRGALLAVLVARAAGDGTHEGFKGRSYPARVAHEPPWGRGVGPRTATTETTPIPTHATADAASSRKSPIRSRSNPSRAPIASPAQAPRNAARTRSGSWPPAEPRISTYRAVWKIPTSSARTGAGPITIRV